MCEVSLLDAHTKTKHFHFRSASGYQLTNRERTFGFSFYAVQSIASQNRALPAHSGSLLAWTSAVAPDDAV